MAYVTIIAMLALIQYFYFGIVVGRARGQYDVPAPAVSGNEQFERVFRAQQNTLEQVVIFVPAIYAAAYFTLPLFAAVAGVLYLVGRFVYFQAYSRDPQSRGTGMILTVLGNALLVLGALGGAVYATF